MKNNWIYLWMIGSSESSLDTKKVCEHGIKVVIELLPVIGEDDMRESHTHEQLQTTQQ